MRLHYFGFAILCMVLLLPSVQAQPTLTRQDLQTVLAPNAIANVDVDNDGDLDIITVSQSYQIWLAVHKNNGDGTFADPLYRLIVADGSGGITDIATGDLNKDGDVDLVISHYSSWSLYVLYGDGTGAFGQAMVIPNIHSVSALVLADFNADTWLDIGVTYHYDPNSAVGILFAESGGTTFGSPVAYPCGSHVLGLETGDLNNDGRPDVVALNWQDKAFTVMLGTPAGTLTAGTRYTVSNWTFGAVLANIVGDSNLDFAVSITNFQGSSGSEIDAILVYEGHGDGSLVLADSLAADPYPLGITAAHINADSTLDLVWVGGFNGYVQIAQNLGDSAFAPAVTLSTAMQPFHLTVADFDENGRPDPVVAAQGDEVLCVFSNATPIVCTDTDFDGYGDPGHPENECPQDNCPSVYNPDQADWDGNGIGDACTPVDTGTNVSVQTTATTTLTFDTVSSGGTAGTTVTNDGPIPPVNFGVVPLGTPQYLNITSSTSYSGMVTITVTYNPNDVVGPEDSLQLLHFDNGVWYDITIARDTAANTITGQTETLSPFVLVEQCCRGYRGNVDLKGVVDLSDLSVLIAYLTGGGYKLPCFNAANIDGLGVVDLSDLSAMVAYLTGGGYQLKQCS